MKTDDADEHLAVISALAVGAQEPVEVLCNEVSDWHEDVHDNPDDRGRHRCNLELIRTHTESLGHDFSKHQDEGG